MQAHLEALEAALGVPVYLVGGMVRDTLLGRTPKDWDVTCALKPEDILERLQSFHVIPTGIKFGTVSVIFPEGVVEVTAHRSEGGYEDGRRPSEVSFGVSLEEDLSRRDFTINSMAMDLKGNLVDPFGGRKDLEAKKIRAVGNPLDRFTEDGLRPMRACRFMSQLGFDIDSKTAQAIPLTLSVFSQVAAERVLVEFTKLLKGPRPNQALRLMTLTGLMATWIPESLEARSYRFGEIEDCPTLLSRQVVFFRPYYEQKSLESILLRSKFASKDISKILRLSELDQPAEFGAEKKVQHNLRKVLQRLQEKDVDPADWLGLPYHSSMESRMNKVLAQNYPLHLKDLALKGEDLLGLFPETKQGPWMASLLKKLMEKVLEDPTLNTKETLTTLAREVYA